MDGFKRLVFRLTPIIMLICFICIGITHTFSRPNDTQPITYLTNQIYTVQEDNPETINIDESITIDNYEFDFQAYRNNINANKIKDATENVIQLDKLQTTTATFNLIWEDGYQIGDIIKTIGNAVLLIININLVIINAVLMPIRIISAILLTIFSLIGININRTEGIIIPFLNGIITYLAIPLISPTAEEDNPQYINITGTTWIFNNTINIQKDTVVTIDTGLTFSSNGQQYNKIIISNTKTNVGLIREYTTVIAYQNDNNLIQAYTQGTWENVNYKTIYINNVTSQSNTTLYQWLNKLATLQVSTNLNNTTWLFNTTLTGITDNFTINVEFTSNSIQYKKIEFLTNNTVIYTKTDNTTQYVYNTYGGVSAWAQIEYRTITITNIDNTPDIEQNKLVEILDTNAVQQT